MRRNKTKQLDIQEFPLKDINIWELIAYWWISLTNESRCYIVSFIFSTYLINLFQFS